MIKAPYNFVPLENRAFYPSWANHISQDIPFEDGVSGSIEYTIEAETPIFVRNGYTDRKDPDTKFSQTPNGQYFIPGTSIKGEIRNVLEILSFGKMTQVQDARFGIRDLSNNPEGRFYRQKIQNVHCGWLYKRLAKDGSEEYLINDCGTPGRIAPEVIDEHYGTALAAFGQNLALNRQYADNDDEEKLRSTYNKYENILNISLESQDIEKSLSGTFSTVPDNYNRIIADFSSNGKKGCIVVTGQPSRREPERRRGKYYEFVFFESNTNENEKVESQIIDDFITIHKNNYDYKNIWKRYLNEGKRVPVFFMRRNGDDGPIDAIGLAYMFRIPTANFIKGAIPIELQSNRRKDLAECIFGTAKESLGQLKGRVNISHAFACGTPNKCGIVTTVLGSPKPSYGPLYASSGTWNDANAQIKGRKRYPVRTTLLPPNEGTDAQTCKFIPLDQGTSFKGRITFHNLKECELGALIAALTFNGHPDCCHSIGEAKPLGYGKVKISIDKLSVISIKDIFTKTDDPTQQETDYYFNKFKDVMTENIGTGWENSNSIRELCAMARGIDANVNNNNFSYMRMSINRNENEFVLNKSEKKENLPTFSSILDNRVLHITEQPDTNRLFKQDIDNDIEEEDSQSLARIDIIETYTVRVPHLITNRDFCKAEKIISEMKRDINGEIRNLADQYQDQIDKTRENDYSISRDEVIHAFNKTENSVNALSGHLNDEDKNNLINRMEQHITSFTELSQRYPNHAIEFMELISRCNTLTQKIRNYGNGILPFLPNSPFNGTLRAYTGRIDRYIRDNGALTDSDKDLICNNIIDIYPGINEREKHPRRGSWSIDSMRRTLIQYLGDAQTTQLIETLEEQ